jgi:hypothetical protein
LRTEATRCFAALLLAGTCLVGCETVPSDFSTSFVDGATTGSPTARQPVVQPRAKPADAALLADVYPEVLEPTAPLQCVPFARDASGIDIYGDAKNWWKRAAGKYPRTRRPQEGAVFVLKGYRTTRRGHVAVVRQVLDERTIVVDHANWGNDGRIYLSAPVRDESPKNDWSMVRVWYTPANQWGKRIYRGRGFILPTTAVASTASGLVSGSH